MRRASIEAALLLVGIGVAGAIAGAAADRLWLSSAQADAAERPCGGRTPDELVELFRTRVSLDAGQMATLEPVLRRGWADVAQVYQDVEATVGPIRERTRATIRAALRPAQEASFTALIAELDERRAVKRRCRQDGIDAARLLGPR